MTLPEYIKPTRSTDLVNTVKHAALGLASELGEVLGVFAKLERGDPANWQDRLSAELGDVAWYLARLTDLCDPQPPLELPRADMFIQPSFIGCANRLWHVAQFLAEHPDQRINCHSQNPDRTEYLWVYWVRMCQLYSIDPSLVLESNLAKLRDRAARRVLQGDGDHR